MSISEYAEKYIDSDPIIRSVAEQRECAWVNPYYLPFAMTDALCQLTVSDDDIADAERRLARFAPYQVF